MSDFVTSRPANELAAADVLRTVSVCRKALAFLLRATRLRVSPESMPAHRFKRLSAELSDALVPLVVSERSPLGFYRALTTRLGVDPTGGESEFGPIEAWLPEGRIRWDRLLSALDYRHMRLVIHENPAFLATFAFSRACDGEAAIFDSFPDPVTGGRARQVLPGTLIAPRSYRTVWTLTSPMAHGADEKNGNVSLFRRHRVVDPRTGEHAYVPFIAGNAVRGMWRDMVMRRWCDLIGLDPSALPTARVHALFAGGTVEAGADSAKVDVKARRAARAMCPPWDLLGGCIDQQIMGGRARVHDAVLVCRENAWLVHAMTGATTPLDAFAETLPEAAELTQLRLATRHAHREYEGCDGTQMLFNTELLVGGAQMLHSLQVFSLEGANEVVLSCLADLLSDFGAFGAVGAGAARGFGLVAFDPYQPGPGTPALPAPEVYLRHVEAHRDEMRDWAMMVAASPVPGAGQPPARHRRGRGPAAQAGAGE